MRGIVAKKLGGDFESQTLKVVIDRLARWHAPGLLFLGDAAHTMGPAAAQGLNLAIRDSVVAANHFLAAIAAGSPITDPVLLAIAAERRPEIEASQAGQLRAYRMVKKPLFALHLMFTMLGAVMRMKKFPSPVLPVVEPRESMPVASVPR
jgi:2-polyprenyl-6-methoxyphenol hydroxylase-like FAD-dependent oxidoreductase